MTSPTAHIRRINRAAAGARGLRFTPKQADVLRAVLELSQADAELLDHRDHPSTQHTEPTP